MDDIRKLKKLIFICLLVGLVGNAMPAKGDLQTYFDSTYRTNVTTLLDFETTVGWTKIAGYDLQNDTTNFKEGTQGLKWVANSSETTNDMSVSWNLSNKQMVIWLYINSSTDYNELTFYFRGSPISEYFYFSIAYDNPHIKVGWNRIVLNQASFTPFGGALPSEWETITVFRFKAQAKSGKSIEVTLDNLQSIPNNYSSGRITIGFDDAYDNVYTNAMPLMDSYGYKGVTFVVTDYVGTAGGGGILRMDVNELTTLKEKGWDVSSHTKTHATLTSLSASQLQTELGESQQWLRDNGFILGSRFIAYSGNAWNSTVLSYVDDYYLGGGRRVTMGQENIPPTTDYTWNALGIINTTALSTVQGWIDNTSTYKSWLTIYFHEIVSPANSTYKNTPDFLDSVLSYINTSGLTVVTLSELYDDLIGISDSNVKLYSSTGNITSVNYTNEKLTLTINASSGTTSTTKVYSGNNTPIYVLNISFNLTRDFNETNKILTVNVTHSSNETITIGFRNSTSDSLLGNSILAIDDGIKLISDPTYSSSTKQFNLTVNGSGTNKNITLNISNVSTNYFRLYDNNQLVLEWRSSSGVNKVNTSYNLDYNSTSKIAKITIPTMSEHNITLQGSLKSDGSSCSANEECSGGYCVHNICRSSSAYCGDAYCDAGESCYNCVGDCGSCPRIGDGGFPPEEEPEEEELPAEEEVLECLVCPDPTKWSDCIDNKQTRTNYRCSTETNYVCESYIETRDCISKEEVKPWTDIFYEYWYIGVIVVVIIVIILSRPLKF